MNKNIKFSVCLLLLGTAFSGCIRDEIEDCPPLKVNLIVKDKNYFNIKSVEPLEDALPTDLDFRQYIPTLYYSLRNLETGEYIEDTGVFDVDHNETSHTINFCPCLPHGKYVLTVWGGLEDEDPLEDDPMTINFHPTNNAGNDIYLTNDTIVYSPYNYEFTFEMERTKGKLLVQLENLPDGYDTYTKQVNNLFSRANNAFSYYESTHVASAENWSGSNALTKTVLTPTVKDCTSFVSLAITKSSDPVAPALTPKDVAITMTRNELTVVRYVWKDDVKDFDIYVLINDNWSLIHGMELE